MTYVLEYKSPLNHVSPVHAAPPSLNYCFLPAVRIQHEEEIPPGSYCYDWQHRQPLPPAKQTENAVTPPHNGRSRAHYRPRLAPWRLCLPHTRWRRRQGRRSRGRRRHGARARLNTSPRLTGEQARAGAAVRLEAVKWHSSRSCLRPPSASRAELRTCEDMSVRFSPAKRLRREHRHGSLSALQCQSVTSENPFRNHEIVTGMRRPLRVHLSIYRLTGKRPLPAQRSAWSAPRR